MAAELPELIVTDQVAWREWLSEHGASSTGVWLVLARKGASTPTTLTYDQALDEALCHGWVDGQLSGRDSDTFRRRFTPRRQGSKWSKRNTELVQRLIAEERMRPAGSNSLSPCSRVAKPHIHADETGWAVLGSNQ